MHSENEGSSRLSIIELAEAALNSQPDTFLVFEPDSGKAVYWNKAFRDISGYSDAEIARLPAPVSYYDSDDLERMHNSMQEHSAADALDIEAQLVCKDGSRVHAEYRISYIADDENKPRYIVSVGRDISERKRSEREQKKYEALCSQSNDLAYICDTNGNILYLNKAFEALSGYPCSEFIGKSFAPLFDEQNLAIANANYVDTLRGNSPKYELVFKNTGVICEYKNTPYRDESGHIIGVLGIARDITQRKLATERATSLGDILEESLNEIYIFDADSFKFIQVNYGARKNLGYSKKELSCLTPLDIKPESIRETFIKHIESLKSGKEKECIFETTHKRKDGSLYPVEVHLQLSVLDSRKVFVAFILDITERKKAEEELIGSEKKFHTLFDNMFNGFALHEIVCNENGTPVDYVFLDINSAFEKMTGLTRDKVLGKKVTAVLPGIETDPADWIRQYGRVALLGEKANFEQYSESLKQWFAISAYSPAKGQFAVIAEDITERKQIEEELIKSEERNNYAQAVGHVGTWDWNVITNELIWSDETFRIFGLTPGECVPSLELFMNFVHVDDRERVSHAIETALNHNQAYNLDCRIIRKDGSEGVANAQGEVLFDQDGKPLRMRGTFQDISERKKLEEQLAQSQKMEAIGTLVGGIAHDFNNMLAGITGHLYLAKEHAGGMPDIATNLDRIEDISFRAADMIQQLLAFARKNIITMKHLTLNPFIKETLKLLRISVPENVKMHWDICSDDLHINGDSTQLHQVLLNLVNNAFDAVEGKDDPSISIRLEAWRPDEAFMDSHAYFKDRPYAHLSVKDNGCGIPEQQVTRLFDPFFTTKELGKGTGLGLSMTYGAIKTHHGFVEVESVEGRGSTFHIYIPLLRAEEIGLSAMKEKKTARGHGELILLVDDESEVIKVGCKVLEVLGYRVLTANNGPEAIELFREHADEVALCIVDIVMPVMNGDKVAHAIRQIKPDINIIFSTGYDKSSLASMENETILRKPYRIEEISSLIRKQIDA